MIRVSVDTAARLRTFGADLGNSALGALGICAVAAGLRWGLVILALSLVGIAARALSMRSLLPTRILLATQSVPRSLLGVGTAVALVKLVGSGQTPAAALGVFLLVGATMYEPYLRKGMQVSVAVVAHLPGIAEPVKRRDVTRTLLVADLSIVGFGLALAWAQASAWWWAVAAGGSLLTRALVIRDSRARTRAANKIARDVQSAVTSYQPEFAVVTSWPADASHQVTMWLPYLARTGRRFIIITRNRVPALALAGLTEVPVIEATDPEQLDQVLPPSLKAVFYPNASSGNGLFVRYSSLTHVFLGHGDSDKPTSYNPTHAMYDKIFASGEAAIRRYADHGIAISPDRFEVVGRPQVEGIHQAREPISATAAPTVLYAPTWRGHVEETRLSSLPVGDRIISALLNTGVTVMFRPHPFSYNYPEDAAQIERIQQLLAADRTASGRRHIFGDAAESSRSIVECTNESDALISDVSSVISDYLFSGKPIVLVAVPVDPTTFVQRYPIAAAAYVVDAELLGLEDILLTVFSTDPMAALRADLRLAYLGPFPAQGYATAFVDAVSKVLDGPRQDRHSDDSPDSESVSAASISPEVATSDESLVDAVAEEGAANRPTTTVADRPAPPSSKRRPAQKRLVKLRRLSAADRRFTQGGAVLALFALATALLQTPTAITAALAIASIAAVYWPSSQVFARKVRWPRLLSEAAATRAVVAATGILVVVDGHWLGEAVALILVAGGLAGEAHIRKNWGKVGADTRNFDALQVAPSEIIPRGLVPVVSFVMLAVWVPILAFGPPAWLVLALAAPAFLIFVVVAFAAFRRVEQFVAAEQRLHTTVESFAPEFVVYFASASGAGYQLGMWLPYFARIGRPFIVVTRVHSTMREIAQAMDRVGVSAPLIYRPTLAGLESIVVGSLQAAFYVNNAARNTHFVERRELTHVWLNHGDSEKPACFNPVHAIYDTIYAAGQAGIDRYARHGVSIPRSKFQIVGRPQVERVQPRGLAAERSGPPTVLYAPTWQGPFADTRFFSLPLGAPIVEKLLETGARVIFRPHPLNYQYPYCVALIRKINRRLAEDEKLTGRGHLWGAAAETAMSVEECFNASDAMIADVSAVISDYLRSDKPYAIVAVGRSASQLRLDAPAAAAAYVLSEDLANLDEVVNQLLGPDPLAHERTRMKTYYLGDFGDFEYADGFLAAAHELLDRPRRASGINRGDAVATAAVMSDIAAVEMLPD